MSCRILSYNSIKCIEPDSFANLENLKLLSFYENDISTLPYNSFKDLKSLNNM